MRHQFESIFLNFRKLDLLGGPSKVTATDEIRKEERKESG